MPTKKKAVAKPAPMMPRRDDFGAEADGYFEAAAPPLAPLARELRSVILGALPGVGESLKWGVPVYQRDGALICAIRLGRDYVVLQFYASGTSLSDPDRLLEGTGQKMRHVKIRSRADIRKRQFVAWLKAADR